MEALAIILSAAIVGLGAVGIVSPARLIVVVRKFQTRGGIYAATIIRLVLGLALFLAAAGSSAPMLLKTLGLAIIVAGLITPMIGLDRFRRLLDWWSRQGKGFIRVWAAFTMVFGSYLVYALAT